MKQLSVIIPAYNSEKYIERCIRSLEAQSLPESEFEIIVIDDGSKDATSKIIDAKFKKIRLMTRKENLGLPYSVNEGIKVANSRYIVRVDSDDYVNNKYGDNMRKNLKGAGKRTKKRKKRRTNKKRKQKK